MHNKYIQQLIGCLFVALIYYCLLKILLPFIVIGLIGLVILQAYNSRH